MKYVVNEETIKRVISNGFVVYFELKSVNKNILKLVINNASEHIYIMFIPLKEYTSITFWKNVIL